MGIGKTSLILMSSILLLVLVPNTADALGSTITRSDIGKMKSSIDTLRTDIINYNEDILQKRLDITIKEAEIISHTAKEKISKEWDRLVNTEGSRNELRDAHNITRTAEKTLTTLNKELQDLINKKLLAENTISSLDKQVDVNEKIIKENSKIELQGLTRVIGIDISKNCRTMIVNGYDHNCPTYEELIQLDSSLPGSGEFSVINGLFQRGSPTYINDHRLYDFEKGWYIIVDPSPILAKNIKMITIVNNLDSYFGVYDNIKVNNIRTIQHERYVDSCGTATISGGNWLFNLPTTIHYLRLGCEGDFFNTEVKITDPITTIDITTSPNYQYSLWLSNAKERCIGLC